MTSPREVVEEVYELHKDVIGTHYENCWRNHAGCLASMLKYLMDLEDGND